MSPGVGAAALLVGLVVALTVGAGGATLAGHIWRRFVQGRGRVLEPVLALFGFAGTASVLTGALLLAWGGSLDQPATVSVADPLFAASICGTLGGQVAVLAWGRALGVPSGLRPAPLRWWILGLAVGGAALLLSAGWLELGQLLGHPVHEQGIATSVQDAQPGLGRGAAVLFIVLIAPVFEELVFRGYLQGALVPSLGPVGAGVASAVIFGLFHLSDPQVVPVLTVMGGLLAWVRHRSGSVGPAIAGHVLNNAAAMLSLLAS
jgi:hypothetical protein